MAGRYTTQSIAKLLSEPAVRGAIGAATNKMQANSLSAHAKLCALISTQVGRDSINAR